jgi:hypothetical protein
VIALDEIHGLSGKVRIFGVGVKTDIGVWISEHFGITIRITVL